MKMTSTGSPASVIARVAGTSALDAAAISPSRPLGSACVGSSRPPPAMSARPCARCSSVSIGLRAMSASGSRSTTSYLSFGNTRWICAPAANEISRSADAPPVSTPTRIFFIGCARHCRVRQPRVLPGISGVALSLAGGLPMDTAREYAVEMGPLHPHRSHATRLAPSPADWRTRRRSGASPLAHQLNLGDEVDVELRFHFGTAAIHQRLHVLRGSIADVHDEVRMLRAHHRAALDGALETGRLDEPPGVVARRVAEDRAGVRLRERLLGDALVGDLLDAL